MPATPARCPCETCVASQIRLSPSGSPTPQVQANPCPQPLGPTPYPNAQISLSNIRSWVSLVPARVSLASPSTQVFFIPLLSLSFSTGSLLRPNLLVPLAPPALKLSVNETLVVNPGENVTVRCLLTGGDPLPQLHWSHGPGPLPLGALAQGGTLSIPSVQARDSGYYNCTATNNVGNPAKKTVNLLVRCK